MAGPLTGRAAQWIKDAVQITFRQPACFSGGPKFAMFTGNDHGFIAYRMPKIPDTQTQHGADNGCQSFLMAYVSLSRSRRRAQQADRTENVRPQERACPRRRRTPIMPDHRGSRFLDC